jgi:hypothetical protein
MTSQKKKKRAAIKEGSEKPQSPLNPPQTQRKESRNIV